MEKVMESALKLSMLSKLAKFKESSIEYDSLVALCGGETNRLKQANIVANTIWEKASKIDELQSNPIEFELNQAARNIGNAIGELHFGFKAGKTKTIEDFKNDWYAYVRSNDGNLAHIANDAFQFSLKAQNLSILLEKYLMLKGLSNIAHTLTTE